MKKFRLKFSILFIFTLLMMLTTKKVGAQEILLVEPPYLVIDCYGGSGSNYFIDYYTSPWDSEVIANVYVSTNVPWLHLTVGREEDDDLGYLFVECDPNYTSGYRYGVITIGDKQVYVTQYNHPFWAINLDAKSTIKLVKPILNNTSNRLVIKPFLWMIAYKQA